VLIHGLEQLCEMLDLLKGVPLLVGAARFLEKLADEGVGGAW
jgi:hypothetical protein